MSILLYLFMRLQPLLSGIISLTYRMIVLQEFLSIIFSCYFLVLVGLWIRPPNCSQSIQDQQLLRSGITFKVLLNLFWDILFKWMNEMICLGWEDNRCALFALYVNSELGLQHKGSCWQRLLAHLWAYLFEIALRKWSG